MFDANFMVKSKRRNPILADVFSRMHYMNSRGFGLKKITDETGRLFNDEGYHVEYYNNNGFFMVTIYNANYNANGIAQEMHSKCIDNFTANEKKVFLEISRNNYITTNEISNNTNLSLRTVANIIKKLKDCNAIVRIGPDKGGYWRIIIQG